MLKKWWGDFKYDFTCTWYDLKGDWKEFLEEIISVWKDYNLDDYNVLGKIVGFIITTFINIVYTLSLFVALVFTSIMLIVILLFLAILGPPLGFIFSFMWHVIMKIIKKK